MNTTTLIAEFVIIGLQASIWLVMSIALISGLEWLDFAKLSQISTPLTLIYLIAVSYTLGAAIDPLTALIEDRLEKSFFPSQLSDADKERRRYLMQSLRVRDKDAWLQVNRDELHLRLLRSTVLNFVIIAITGSVLLLVRTKLNLYQQLLYCALLIGSAVMGTYGWWRRRKGFVKNRTALYSALQLFESQRNQGTP